MGAAVISGARLRHDDAAAKTVTPLLIAAVVLLGAVGPLATDMYVPAFPHVAADLVTSTGSVQLTLTTFFLGMGLGQLVGGPVSDQIGRKRPLLVGTLVTLAASIICAIAPSIGVMLVAEAFFSTLSKVPITDPRKATEALFSLSLDSRDEVDALVRKAIAAGATEGHDPEDLGFMYSWAYVDLDGHQWGVFHMDASQMPAQ